MTEELALACRLGLGVTLLAAAFGKVRSREGLPLTLQALGAGRRQASPVATALVAAEASLGLLLLLGMAAVLIALAVLWLLSLFLAASLRAVRLGAAIPCNCFGRSESLLGWATATRALALTAATATYLATSLGGSQVGWPGDFAAAAVGVSLAVAWPIAVEWLVAAPRILAIASARRRVWAPRRPRAARDEDPAFGRAGGPT